MIGFVSEAQVSVAEMHDGTSLINYLCSWLGSSSLSL